MRRSSFQRLDHATSNDPAEWNSCSRAEHPVDLMEPEPAISNEFRECALLFLGILEKVDSRMSTCRDARKTWIAFSISVGLHSTAGRTLTDIAQEMGITKQALSRDVALFGRLTGMEPAFGLKSIQARQTYRACH